MPNLDKTIRCLVLKTSYKNDTSLGNRLHCWAQAYFISKRTNFEYKILVQKEFWPELIYLNLPHTYVKDKDKFVYDEKSDTLAETITEDHLDKIILENDLSILKTQNHWCISEWYILNETYKGRDVVKLLEEDPFTKINFKQKEINQFFKDKFSNFVGIHIRRNAAIYFKPGDMETLPKHIQELYIKEVIPATKYYTKDYSNQIYRHPFIRDTQYHAIIDKILEIKPNQIFYLSADLPLKYFDYYKEKYFKHIHDRDDYISELIEILKKYYPPEVIEKTKYIVSDLLDIFALSQTKLIIQSYASSWGRSASRRGKTDQIILPLHGNMNLKYQIRKALF